MKIIFLSTTKLGSNTANILNFFKINLHFDTLNYIKSTYRKLHLVLIGLHFPKIAKKTLTDQSAVQVFLLCPKRNNSQTHNKSSCKCFFLQCIYYCYNLEKIIFHKNLLLPWNVFSTTMLLISLKEVLKLVRVLCYLHNNYNANTSAPK